MTKGKGSKGYPRRTLGLMGKSLAIFPSGSNTNDVGLRSQSK